MATNFSTGTGLTVNPYFTNDAGQVRFATCTVANIPSAVAGYAVSCIIATSDTGSLYVNTGSATSCTFTKLDTASASLTLPVSATDASTTTTDSMALTMSALTTGNGLLITAASATTAGVVNITTPSSNALVVGRQGKTNPAFQVDASAATSVTGIKVTAAASGSGAALAAISSATDEALTVNAKGAGQISIGGVSTGLVRIGQGSASQTIQGGTVTALGATQNSTPTAAQLLGGIVTQQSQTGGGTVTTPTGTQLDTAIPNIATGDSFRVRFANIGTQTLTITAGASGITIVGTATVATNTNIDLLFVRTGTNTWICYTNK